MTNSSSISPALALKLDIDAVQRTYQVGMDAAKLAKALIVAIKRNDLCAISRVCCVNDASLLQEAVELIQSYGSLQGIVDIDFDAKGRVVLTDRKVNGAIAINREGRISLAA